MITNTFCTFKPNPILKKKKPTPPKCHLFEYTFFSQKGFTISWNTEASLAHTALLPFPSESRQPHRECTASSSPLCPEASAYPPICLSVPRQHQAQLPEAALIHLCTDVCRSIPYPAPAAPEHPHYPTDIVQHQR